MSWDLISDIITSVLLLAGGLLTLSAGVGLLRFGDLLSRMHSTTKPHILGLVMILVGAAFQLGAVGAVAGLLLVASFQLITAPVTAHIVGRAAYHDMPETHEPLVIDELAHVKDLEDD